MKKIKILQFPIANSFGGITHYALENWKWMDKNRFQCDFATMSKKIDFAEGILSTGSKIHYISCYAEENEEMFIQEFNKILDEGYDVVHLHTKQWKSFLVEKLCKEHRVPKVIVHAHSTGIDTLDQEKRRFEELQHEQVKREFDETYATDFWACSKPAANFLFGDRIPANRIRIMPNAIEIDRYMYNEEVRRNARKQLNLEDSLVIGHVGRFVYQKNHEFLIDVFAKIAQKIPQAKLLLIGDGELCDEIKRKISRFNLENRVIFMGKREDVYVWYQAMDMFLLPSRFEGLGIVLVEAQAAGLPCICSDHVPQEILLSDNICLLSLNEKEWMEQVMNYMKRKRNTNINSIKEAGYDIKWQIQYIEQEYMK